MISPDLVTSYLIPVDPSVSIRVNIINNVHYLSILDLIMCFGNQQALDLWKQMPKDGLGGSWIVQVKQPMITLAGALKLMPLIPGSACDSVANMVAIITHHVTKMECAKVPSETALISFDEIVSGATVRLAVINSIQYLSVRDVIMYMCGKDNKQASQIWERISSDHKEELSSFCRNFQFPAKHSTEPPVHRQWVDGAERWVKSYTERDRQLIEDAIAEVI